MKKKIIITTPLNKDIIEKLKIRDAVLITGNVYTARDQAHLRLVKLIKKRRKLPFSLKNQIIYYTGPTPRRNSSVIGSCGPTTSGRMDKFTPVLLKAGVKVLIGKGKRSPEVIQSIKKHKAVYLVAPAGAGAYLSTKVRKAEVVAFRDLGPEAIYRLEVKNFPAVVCIDSKGNNLYAKFNLERKEIICKGMI